MQDSYSSLDDLVTDVIHTVGAQIKHLESTGPDGDALGNDEAIAKAMAFKNKALELYRRELAYPNVARPLAPKPDLSAGSTVLTAYGAAPTLRPLFTSLQRVPDGIPKPVPDDALPNGVTTSHILPEASALALHPGRPLTLGELFPSPRGLPPLQPSKPSKPAKSNVLTFYHPELTEKSKYKQNTYFSQAISTGSWLDYSNATPTTRAKTKQRERAQSLAGKKPSSTELEMSEMESLFRGAFSSFAPCKDDTAAIVPSRQVSRLWWQRVGCRSFEKMIDAESPEEEAETGVAADSSMIMEIDDEEIKKVVDNWDPSLVDPSLDEALGKKSDHDKEVDDLLEEVSDLIETLASYQRNRNLTVPTSQDRYSADPVNGDMLRNNNLSHQPSEEEMLTYQALKAQLSLIINTLPPYAVARLNSDKLAELSVSTKIEIRTDEYRGVMEEDEPARLARQQAATAATANQRQPHRASSVSAQGSYHHQFPGQFTPSARPVQAQHFPQTPVRPQPNMYPRGPSTVPVPRQAHHPPPSQPPPSAYRGQNSYYPPQIAKAQPPYGHSNMPPYAGTPNTQPRMAPHPHPGYPMGGQPVGPPQNNRYPPGYPGQGGNPGYQPPMHNSPHHPQHAPMPPQQGPPQGGGPGYPAQYPNGGMPRNMAPNVPPQGMQHNPYAGQTPTPPQQHQQIPRGPPPYNHQGGPGGMPGTPHQQRPQQPYGGPGGGMMGTPGGPGGPGGGTPVNNRGPPPNLTGYATVMPEVQQRQVMEQARARADAEQRVSGHMGKVQNSAGQMPGQHGQGQQHQQGMPQKQGPGEVVGLAGIGLGGNVDVHKIAAAKAMQMGGPSNMMPSPQKMGGMPGPGPAMMNGGGPGGIMPRPPSGPPQGPGMAFNKPPTPVPIPGPPSASSTPGPGPAVAAPPPQSTGTPVPQPPQQTPTPVHIQPQPPVAPPAQI